MKAPKKKPLPRRLREVERELDMLSAENARLRERYSNAMRQGQRASWPSAGRADGKPKTS
jgi:hypothetical protein